MHVRVHGKAVRSIGPKGGSEQEIDYQSQSCQQGTDAGCETKPNDQVGPALCRGLFAHIPRIAEGAATSSQNATSGSAARLRGGDSWRGTRPGQLEDWSSQPQICTGSLVVFQNVLPANVLWFNSPTWPAASFVVDMPSPRVIGRIKAARIGAGVDGTLTRRDVDPCLLNALLE